MLQVHELATELEVPSSKVLEVLAAIGINAKNQTSTISDVDAARVRNALRTKKVSGTLAGKRDFRIRDISTPKSPAVRPRPSYQRPEPPQLQQRKVITRKVVRRVVRRAEPEGGSPTVIEVPEPQQVIEAAPPPVVSAEPPKVPAVESPPKPEVPRREPRPERRPLPPKPQVPPKMQERPRDRDRDRGGGGGGDRRRGGGGGGGQGQGQGQGPRQPVDNQRRPSSRSEQRYAPVGKDQVRETGRGRPPKPKVPKIPNPEDYLRPKESTLIQSMEKLAAGGMRSTIDTAVNRGPQAAQDKRHKRRRKIITGPDKTFKKPGPGKERPKDTQLRAQLETSTTIRRRGRPGPKSRRERMSQLAVKALPKKVRLGEHVSIRDLSAQAGLKSSDIIGFLMKEFEILATINQVVDQEIGGLICDHFGFEYEMKKVEQLEDVIKYEESSPDELKHRPPVVTVLGHVDHGKTKLLDAIRGTDVVSMEAGGITQKIGAFQVEHKFKDGTIRPVTFIDTPGHAAFTAMRARGAQVTDVAILVVAANDGVMPQTLEAIDHARSAGVEIVVAINKIDLPEANQELVKQQLSTHGLVPEEWGGQTIMVPISAKKKIAIEDLLEQVLTVADILELQANPTAPVEGTIIEARLDRGRGALATCLVQRGTLKLGDYVVAGRSWGKVRQMTDETGIEILEAPPSTPVMISGLNSVPQAGDKLNQIEDERTARDIYEKREMEHRQGRLRMVNTISLEDFYEQMKKGETKELNIILKADLQGSIEAVRGQLEQISTSEVRVKFIHTAVGNITDSDIMLALASKAIIVGFNVVASPEIRKQAAMEGIDIRTYNIIYKVVDDIRAALEGLLEPTFEEHTVGKAEVKAIFKRTGRMVVAGLMVNEGRMSRGATVRIKREGEIVITTSIYGLKRFKDDVNEVESGLECGVMFDNFNDLREGDAIEAYETVKILRTLDGTRRQETHV